MEHFLSNREMKTVIKDKNLVRVVEAMKKFFNGDVTNLLNTKKDLGLTT